MNLRKLMYKLQKALCKKGIHVKINQQQFYLESVGRMATKFILKVGNETILETFQQADVVKKLAELYEGG